MITQQLEKRVLMENHSFGGTKTSSGKTNGGIINHNIRQLNQR